MLCLTDFHHLIGVFLIGVFISNIEHFLCTLDEYCVLEEDPSTHDNFFVIFYNFLNFSFSSHYNIIIAIIILIIAIIFFFIAIVIIVLIMIIIIPASSQSS